MGDPRSPTVEQTDASRPTGLTGASAIVLGAMRGCRGTADLWNVERTGEAETGGAEPYTAETGAGFEALAMKRWPVAAVRFRRAAITRPEMAIPWYGIGFSALQTEDSRAAIRFLTRSAACLSRRAPPKVGPEIFTARGLAHRRTGADEKAGRDCRRALVMAPSSSNAAHNLANLSADRGDRATAWRTARFVTVLRPTEVSAWNNLGRVENDAGKLAAARRAYRRALVFAPGWGLVWNNLGITDKRDDDIPAAIIHFRRAVTCDPGFASAWANLGRNLLLVGDLGAGWRALEWERRRSDFAPVTSALDVPVWNGDALGRGALVVWSEEKIGDDILFASLLPDVAKRAGRVVYLCNPRLERLFDGVFDPRTIAMIPWPRSDGRAREPLPPIDRSHSPWPLAAGYPLEFVGRFVRNRPEDFPPPIPYLRRSVRERSPRMDKPADGLRIGLAWHSVNSLIGTFKSQRLRDWTAILDRPGARFFSLQYGDNRGEIADVRRETGLIVEEPAGIDQLSEMASFATFVAGLDLVISIPNTTVHVAGSLGVPTWVMLPTGPGLSWFWFQDREHALWYPRMRLFRQGAVGEWGPVLDRVARALTVEWTQLNRRRRTAS